MIIGIDASRANLSNKTGTEWYAFFIIQELKKLVKPTDKVILYTKEKISKSLLPIPDNFENKVLKWPPKYLWTQFRLAWEMLIFPPEVLFVPAHTIPVICPSKTVTTIHDVGFEEYKNLYSKKSIGPLNPLLKTIINILIKLFTLGKYRNSELDYHRWSTRLAIKKAIRILTVSNFSKSEIIKHFKVNENKIVVIPNSFNPMYKKAVNDIQLQNSIKKFNINGPFFLYIGRLEYKKNTPKLIKAFYEFKAKGLPFKLVLVGEAGFGYDAVKFEIKNGKYPYDVIELGWLNDTELVTLYNKAEAFIFPSNYEGFGIPILEAMSSGVPVITSNFGAMKEVAGDAALLINSNNTNELVDAMYKISTQKGLRDKLISKGFTNIKKYSWNKSAKEILNILYKI